MSGNRPSSNRLRRLNESYHVKIHVRERTRDWTFTLRWWDNKHKKERRLSLDTQSITDVIKARERVENTLISRQRADAVFTSRIQLSEFRLAYLEHCHDRNLSRDTIKTTSWMLNALTRFLNDKQLAGTTSQDIETYISKQLKKGRKPRGVLNDLKTFRTAFNWAVRKGWMSKNPANDVESPRVPRQAPHRLSGDEFQRLLIVIDREEDQAIALMLVLTGLRISELLSLKWSDIHLSSGYLIVKGKGGHEREVFIGSLLTEVLKSLPRHEGTYLVFPGFRYHGRTPIAHGRKSYSPLRNRFKNYFRKAGVDSAGTFHRFRHTFAGFLGDAGKSAFELKQLLGHAKISTSEIYTHIGGATLRQTVESLNEEVRRLVSE